ncbi:MAG: endolytic transglycosylase MltG [Methylococcaceae bacterium]
MPTYSWEKSSRRLPGAIKLFALFLGAGLLFVAVIVGRFVFKAWYSTPRINAPVVSIAIGANESLTSVASDIDTQGIADSLWFRFYTKFFDDATVFPGVYTLTVGESYQKILENLRGGKEVVKLTIPEGFSLAQIGERIHQMLPSISVDSWNTAVEAGGMFEGYPFVLRAQKPKSVDLEGYLFPDTYEFSTDAAAADVVLTMLQAMEGHINDLGTLQGDAKDMTIHQALTLASIVEKEVRTAGSMGNVADIFLKRLAINMALQADSTVNYVIHGTDPSVSLDDTKIDSPYNTYKYPGLPPGPISSPSLNALTAVFHPIHNEYYYFLTTDTGEIYYAKTFEEHVRNKWEYLK